MGVAGGLKIKGLTIARAASSCIVALAVLGGSPVGAQQTVAPELAERLSKEKDARKACKVDICKAFAAPAAGAPIQCDVTKTWLKDEIVGRVVGGSYVWGYGHMQCTVKLNLDRGEIQKAMKEPQAKATFAEHTFTCNVEDADPAKGQAFTVKASINPVVTFEKGEAKSVAVDPVKTEGSGVASAAVTSMMTVDKVSGLVSRAAAGEINAFLFEKCKADGVEIARK